MRADFPILRREVHGYPLCYLDSAATSQKPEPVLAAMDTFYRTTNANIHRGVYQLSEEATAQYEGARARIAAFINAAQQPRDHLHAQRHRGHQPRGLAWGRANLRPGDAVLYTEMEHHCNLVPWQLIAAERGARCATSRSTSTAAWSWTTSTGCWTASRSSPSPR